MAQGRPLAEGGRGVAAPSTWVVKPMSKSDSAAHESAATTRRIDDGRFARAITENMDAAPIAPHQYEVVHDEETYVVDVAAGHCGCDDHRYRGDQVVCKHQCAAAIRHCYRDVRNTELVARVLAHARSTGCPHGYSGCPGPTGPSLPCEDCIRAIGAGHWTVWQHTERTVREDATVDRGAGVATDGGSDQPPTDTALDDEWLIDGRASPEEDARNQTEPETCAQCGREGVERYVCQECADANDDRREDDIAGSERADFGGSEGGIDSL